MLSVAKLERFLVLTMTVAVISTVKEDEEDLLDWGQLAVLQQRQQRIALMLEALAPHLSSVKAQAYEVVTEVSLIAPAFTAAHQHRAPVAARNRSTIPTHYATSTCTRLRLTHG